MPHIKNKFTIRITDWMCSLVNLNNLYEAERSNITLSHAFAELDIPVIDATDNHY